MLVEPLLLYMPLLIMQMFWTLVGECSEIFLFSLVQWLFFFIVHIDDYFLTAQICEAHFNKKMEMNCLVTKETVVLRL